MRIWIHFDGGGQNPGESACAAVVFDEAGREVCSWGNKIGPATNNIAEYEGLLLGLRMAHSLGATDLTILGDSMLVVRQVNGDWKVKDPKLRGLHAKAIAALAQFDSWALGWHDRERNSAADAKVRETLGVKPKKRTDWKGLARDLADRLYTVSALGGADAREVLARYEEATA